MATFTLPSLPIGMQVVLAAHQSRSLNGIGTYARGLSEWLPHRLDPRDGLLVVDGRALEGRPDPPNVRRVTLSGPMRSGRQRLVHEQLRLPRAARGADLLHLCDCRPVLATRTPFLLTIHDVVFLDRPDFTPPAVARYKAAMLRAAIARRPAGIACVSRFSADRLLHHFPQLRDVPLEVAYPGVRQEPAPVPSPNGAAPFFLTVGDLEPRKNHLGLLEAFSRARAAGLGLRWKVVGRPTHAAAPILAALREADGVDLVGQVSDAELERLYGAARFLVIPSLYEGFGLPCVEAMARGLPVLCSTGSALDEVVADGGLRVDSADVGALAGALRDLERDDGALADLRSRGRARAARVSFEACAGQLVEELYPRLRLGRRG